jgi:hypothetical protein
MLAPLVNHLWYSRKKECEVNPTEELNRRAEASKLGKLPIHG